MKNRSYNFKRCTRCVSFNDGWCELTDLAADECGCCQDFRYNADMRYHISNEQKT